MGNIFKLHHDLRSRTYTHGGYEHFVVTDPKRRDIHKASVRDRLIHHAIYRVLYQHFDKRFIHDSYSCRNNKGTHKAIEQFQRYARKVSENHTRTCYVLKCDIRKFFVSIDHEILIKLLEKQIPDRNIMELLKEVIQSFYSTELGKGLPLGNLTSQLLVNIYMNVFDHYVKQVLKHKHYVRYADDFVLLHYNQTKLQEIQRLVATFLEAHLKLKLHPNKVSITTFASGVDFLGWVHFPTHRILRAVTKRWMFKRLVETEYTKAVVVSYVGLLRHGNGHELSVSIKSETVA